MADLEWVAQQLDGEDRAMLEDLIRRSARLEVHMTLGWLMGAGVLVGFVFQLVRCT